MTAHSAIRSEIRRFTALGKIEGIVTMMTSASTARAGAPTVDDLCLQMPVALSEMCYHTTKCGAVWYEKVVEITRSFVSFLCQHNRTRTLNVDLRNQNVTILLVVSELGLTDIAKVLIDGGALVDTITLDRCTPLSIACQEGHLTLASLLIDYGAVVDASTDDDTHTPMSIACQRGHREIVSLLLDRGVAVNNTVLGGITYLSIACQTDNQEVAELLIDRGADLDMKTSSGTFPLSIACSMGNLSMVKLLLDRGADIKQNLDEKGTSLHLACFFGDLKMVILLVDRGADIDYQINTNLPRPLWIAYREGHEEIVTFLLARGAAATPISGKNNLSLLCEGHRGIEIRIKVHLAREERRRREDLVVTAVATSVVASEAVVASEVALEEIRLESCSSNTGETVEDREVIGVVGSNDTNLPTSSTTPVSPDQPCKGIGMTKSRSPESIISPVPTELTPEEEVLANQYLASIGINISP